MNGFSLSDAWSECIAFIRDNLVTLLIVIVGTTVIGWIMNLLFFGGFAGQANFMQTMAGAQGDPTAVLAAMGGGVFLILLISYIITSASYFLAWRTGLSRPSQPLPSAIAYALGAGALWLLVFVVAFILYVVVVGILFGLLGVSMIGAGGAGAGLGLGFILTLALLLFTAWLIGRFIAAGPAMAAAGSYNPFYGLATSWQLTARHQLAVWGYMVLLGIVGFVLLFLIGILFGGSLMAMGAASGGGSIGSSIFGAMIMGVVIGIPLTMLAMGIPVGVYRALAPRDETANIFS
jgi:hypothetical protein